MKYSILGFKQEWLVNEAENSGCKIDITDLVILRWVIELMSKDSAKKKVINGKEYVWVNYNTLIDDMLILGIKKRALRERLNVHHRNYDCHGKEHKHYKADLICLCEDCHQKFHDKLAE